MPYLPELHDTRLTAQPQVQGYPYYSKLICCVCFVSQRTVLRTHTTTRELWRRIKSGWGSSWCWGKPFNAPSPPLVNQLGITFIYPVYCSYGCTQEKTNECPRGTLQCIHSFQDGPEYEAADVGRWKVVPGRLQELYPKHGVMYIVSFARGDSPF